MTSGGNNFYDFPEKQVTKFSLNDDERGGNCLLVSERSYGPGGCVYLNWLRETGRRPRGRPQKTWRLTFSEDLQELKITLRGAKIVIAS